MKRKIYVFSFLCLLLLFDLLSAENIVFPDFSSQVSHLELDLKLFDFAVNHLNTISSGPLTYINSISSRKEHGDVVEFVHLVSVRFLSLSAETLNRLGHG